MKKIICALLLVVMLGSMLAACSFKCDVCEQTKSGKKTTEEVAGEKITYCEDCKEAVQALKDLEKAAEELEDLADSLS